jgi:hypothetical protein
VGAGITDYILSGYSGAESGTANFDLKNISPSESRKIRFVISLPQLKNGDAGVKIKKIEIEFAGERAGWGWIKNKLGNFIGRIL